MSRAGIDSRTGKPLVGWDHVVQSIAKILSTELGSRIQRRDFGSLLPRLLDRPQNQETVINFFMATAEAIEPRRVRGRWYGEPGFHLVSIGLTADVPGLVGIEIRGLYFPRGHLGDQRSASPREITYSANRLADIIEFHAVG